MKKFLFAVLLLTLMNLNLFAEDKKTEVPLDQEIKTNCGAKWGDNYRMQKYCYDQQFKAAGELYNLTDKYTHGTEERKMLAICASSKWKSNLGGGIDYRMIVYCSEKQIEAYHELYGQKSE